MAFSVVGASLHATNSVAVAGDAIVFCVLRYGFFDFGRVLALVFFFHGHNDVEVISY